jgi:hypothetical protein
VNAVSERQYLQFDQPVEYFAFVNVKSVTRASSGHQVNQAIAVAYPGGDVRLLDLFGN